MLHVVDIRIGVIQCMEKISKDKIPFRDEALMAQLTRGRKATKQGNFLFSSGPIEQTVPQNNKFEAPQFIQHSQLFIKSPSTIILHSLRYTR